MRSQRVASLRHILVAGIIALVAGWTLQASALVAIIDGAALCEMEGGTWNECGSGCGPLTCYNPTPSDVCPEVCIPQCECPTDTPYWDEIQGCQASNECPNLADDQVLCEIAGGLWDECGSGCGPKSCENPDPGPECLAVCVPQCLCPANAPYWGGFQLGGCVDAVTCGISAPGELSCDGVCGGINLTPEGEYCGCDASCVIVGDCCDDICDFCADADPGITAYCGGEGGEEPQEEGGEGDITWEEYMCDETGGSFNTCGSGCGPATCVKPDPGNLCPDICIPQCECPENAPIWGGELGCIPFEACGGEEGGGEFEEVIALCDATGGAFSLGGSGCGPATCDNPEPGPECPAVETPMCVCPDSAPYWDEENGCIDADACGGEVVEEEGGEIAEEEGGEEAEEEGGEAAEEEGGEAAEEEGGEEAEEEGGEEAEEEGGEEAEEEGGEAAEEEGGEKAEEEGGEEAEEEGGEEAEEEGGEAAEEEGGEAAEEEGGEGGITLTPPPAADSGCQSGNGTSLPFGLFGMVALLFVARRRLTLQ